MYRFSQPTDGVIEKKKVVKEIDWDKDYVCSLTDASIIKAREELNWASSLVKQTHPPTDASPTQAERMGKITKKSHLFPQMLRL